MILNGKNIDFLITALIVGMFTNLAYESVYADDSPSSRAFGYVCRWAMIAAICDLLYQFCKIPSDVIFYWRGVGRLLFNMSIIGFALSYYNYSRSVAENLSFRERKRTGWDYVVTLIGVLMLFCCILNFWTHGMESQVVNGKTVYQPIYFSVFIFPFFIMMIGLATQIRHRNRITKGQIIVSTLLGFIFNFSTILEIMLGSKVLLSMFGMEVSVILLMMTCETKDYASLVKTVSELEVSKNRAEKANHAKSDFLARMSHEIRTPMNAILGLNEMIIKETDNSTIKGYATDAYSAGRNLLLIINDILDFSKIESGKMELLDMPFNVREIVRDEWVIFNNKAQEKNLDLRFEIDEHLPKTLQGDGGRIKQVITNILGNAIKYTEVSSVTMRVELLSTKNGIAKIRTSVIDTGRGIKDADIGKLFEAFERINEKENAKIEGTGLGINITARLLKLMNSELKVESEVGKGSNFHFTIALPIVDATEIGDVLETDPAEQNHDTEQYRDPVASRTRVLVVDDTKVNLKVFKALLKNTGMKITTAGSGEQAIAFAHDNRYDLIFMDHLMPMVDGVEALKSIRADATGMNRETPIVALTANAIKGADAMYRDYGFDGVLFKPYTQTEIYRTLTELLPRELFDEGF